MNKRTYAEAANQTWELLRAIGKRGGLEVEFLGNIYRVDFERRSIVNLTGDNPVKEYHLILILPYLAREKSAGTPEKIRVWPVPPGATSSPRPV